MKDGVVKHTNGVNVKASRLRRKIKPDHSKIVKVDDEFKTIMSINGII